MSVASLGVLACVLASVSPLRRVLPTAWFWACSGAVLERSGVALRSPSGAVLVALVDPCCSGSGEREAVVLPLLLALAHCLAISLC